LKTTTYFGRKQSDPNVKTDPMETDCGGAMITRSSMTYGEADALAESVELDGYVEMVEGLTPSAYWRSPYEDPKPEGLYFRGEVWWSVYRHLVLAGYIDGKADSYNNSMEYLYGLVLKRLVEAGVWEPQDEQGRWFRWMP